MSRDPKKWLAQRLSAATQGWRTVHASATKAEAQRMVAGELWPTRVILRTDYEAELTARRGSR